MSANAASRSNEESEEGERSSTSPPGDAEERLKRSVPPGVDTQAEGRPKAKSGMFNTARPTPSLDRPTETQPGDAAAPARVTHTPRTPGRELVQLAWPIAAAMLGETAIGLVDTKIVGGLGPAALGGVGVGTATMFLGYALVFGLMRGVKVCVAHAIGEGRAADASAYARAGVLMGLAIGTIELVVCRDVSPFLRFIGADPSIIPYARDFLAAVTLGAPSTCALAALIQHRQAIGDARTPMIVGIGGNVFNALLGWSLVYGHFGLPALGVRGSGISTATTETVELLVMGAMLLYEERRASASVRATIGLRAAVGEVASVGLPTGGQYFVEMIAFMTFTAVIGGISASEIASHQIALNVIRVSFLPGLAVSEAACVLVGRSLGARDLGAADAFTKSALRVAVGFMAACGVVFALAGGLIAQFFASDEGVVVIARRLLLVAAVFQVLDAVNIVLRGALRGAKDVRAVAILGIASVWAFVPTGAYFLGKVGGLGALGGWLGFVGETSMGALLFFLRWRRGGWRARYASPTR